MAPRAARLASRYAKPTNTFASRSATVGLAFRATAAARQDGASDGSIQADPTRAPASVSRSLKRSPISMTANCCWRTIGRGCSPRSSFHFVATPMTQTSALDDDLRADLGQGVKLLGKLHRHADTAVAGRVAGIRPAVEGDPIFIDALHPRHWCIVVFLGPVHRALLENGPEAQRGNPPRTRGGHAGRSDKLVA